MMYLSSSMRALFQDTFLSFPSIKKETFSNNTSCKGIVFMHKGRSKLEKLTRSIIGRWQALSLLSIALILIGAVFVFPHYKVTLASPATPAVHTLVQGDWSNYMYDIGHSGYNSTETAINNAT